MANSSEVILRERLLCVGIAPRHARRLAQEWATHRASLVDEGLLQGLPPKMAQVRADQRLGTSESLVAQAVGQPALKSWGARWPIAICGLMPVVTLLFCHFATLLLLIAASAVMDHSRLILTQVPHMVRSVVDGLCILVLYGLPLVWAGLWVRYAVERRIVAHWPLVGVGLASVLGALTNLSVVWPQSGADTSMSAGIGISTADAQWLRSFGLRASITFACVASLYVIAWRRRAVRFTEDAPLNSE